MDSIQQEQEILGQKNFIEIQMKYLELLNKNISNQDALNKLANNLNNINKPFDKYVNKILFQYKDIVGRAMMGLTIGMFTIIMLEVLAYIFRREEEMSNKTWREIFDSTAQIFLNLNVRLYKEFILSRRTRLEIKAKIFERLSN